jgi:ubiquinone/menaquinone biosynthesis C-methylase UbiE
VRIYSDWILPWLIDFAMQNARLAEYRQGVVSAAEGSVLEVGIGSGLNLPFYGKTQKIYGIDPSPRLLALARTRAGQASVDARLLCASAEELPFASASMDSIVMTWTLCSIPSPPDALKEMRRVLKRDGTLLFVEHGLAPDRNIVQWQNWLTPIWKRIGGGCHLNRKMDDLIRAAGFEIIELRTDYMPGPKPMTYMYRGRARVA